MDVQRICFNEFENFIYYFIQGFYVVIVDVKYFKLMEKVGDEGKIRYFVF